MYVEMYCRVDGLMHADDANPELEKWMKATAGSSHYRRTLGEVLKLPFEHVIGCAVPIQRFLNCVLTFKEDITDIIFNWGPWTSTCTLCTLPLADTMTPYICPNRCRESLASHTRNALSLYACFC